MFNLQGGELIIILLLALVVLGPEKLPDAMRKAGQFYAELKKMSTGFQSEFRAAVDEPLKELRDTANVIRDSADFTKLQNGEREEKPKSAEMLAAADPAATPTDDLPFTEAAEAAEAADGEPIEDVSPTVQEPFSSVIISNSAPRRAHPSLAPEPDATDEGAEGAATEDADLERPVRPQPFGSASVSSAAPPQKPSPSADVTEAERGTAQPDTTPDAPVRPQPFGSGSISSAAPPSRAPLGDAGSESVGSTTESLSTVDDGPPAGNISEPAVASESDAGEPTA